MRTIIGAVAAAALAIVAAPATAAADPIDIYRSCDDGAQILRCVELHYDTVNHRFRAHAGVLDKPGGADYNVDVVSTTADGHTNEDVDGWYGWWADGDTGQSPLWPPPGVGCGPARYIGFSTTVRWQNVATGAVDLDKVDGVGAVCY